MLSLKEIRCKCSKNIKKCAKANSVYCYTMDLEEGRFVNSQKNTPLLEDSDGHRYRIHHHLKIGSVGHYKCVKNGLLGCPATALYNNDLRKVTSKNGVHVHDDDLLK